MTIGPTRLVDRTGPISLAVLSSVLMVVLRWSLDPWLGDQYPFVTVFSAVAASAYYGGWRSGLAASLVSLLLCEVLFVGPRGTLRFGDSADFVAVIAYVVTCTAIVLLGETARRARADAAAEHGRLRTTLASIGDAVIATDDVGNVTYLNEIAEELTGWSASEAEGRPLTDVFRIVNERSRATVENPVEKVLRSGGIVGLANHTVLIARDGSEVPIDDSAAPIRDKNGPLIGVVLVFRDVTEQRRAQLSHEHLAAIVQHSGDAIVTKDLDGVVQSWNSSAEALFGYTAAEIVGKPFTTVIPEDRLGEEVEILDRLRRGQVSERFETLRRAKDGRLIPVAASVSPLRNDEGEVIGASSILHDITAIVAAREELAHQRELLEIADRRKDEFLAMLAHELRNPLAPIRNSLQLVRGATNDPQVIESASAVMERQVDRMVRLVDDLLDVARISRGKIELRRERATVAAIVEQAIEMYRPVCEERRQLVEVSLPPEPLVVDADVVRLTQVLGNLIHNSCKYTDPGGHITVRAERNGSKAEIRVRDTGIGIPPAQLPLIFEMFAQVDQSLERAQGGLGIGLTLAKQLVEMHSGTIEARSEGTGRGTEIIVRLPLSEPDDRGDASAPPSEGQAAASRRILVVDDNSDSADSLSLLLRMSGHETREAYDGPQALAAAAAFQPEVVLLDIGLPRMNGHEVCRRLRENEDGHRMTIIALTGWGQESDRNKSKQAGFDHHLVKPVDLDELAELLEKGGDSRL
jgi:PAS domain S-box-containing protein